MGEFLVISGNSPGKLQLSFMVEIAAEVWWFTLKCKLCDTDYVGKTQ
jgi:hypothetical protein